MSTRPGAFVWVQSFIMVLQWVLFGRGPSPGHCFGRVEPGLLTAVVCCRKLIVCHYKKGTEICNYSYSNTILAVKLNRSVSAPPLPAPALAVAR